MPDGFGKYEVYAVAGSNYSTRIVMYYVS